METLEQIAASTMLTRLQAALKDDTVRVRVYNDLKLTLMKLGLSNHDAELMVEDFIIEMMETEDIVESERKLYAELSKKTINGLPLPLELDRKMSGRAELIYHQVCSYFNNGMTIVDYGCGDGQVTDLISQRITPDIDGWDIRSYPAPNISIELNAIQNQYSVPVADRVYDAGLMTNVAHHDADNEKILNELARIIKPGGRLVVIETVPVSDDPVEFEVTFVNDYFYNRILHQADVPVPGTYNTAEGWIERFRNAEFEITPLEGGNPIHLGYDQPLIRDYHVLYVFTRV